jgi:SAM-dependent methyltransferase
MLGLEAYRLPQELLACPACASPRIVHLHAVRSPRFRKEAQKVIFVSGCRSCGLLFVNPPKSEAELAAYYQADGGWNDRVPERIERAANLSATPARKDVPDDDVSRGIVQAAVVHARQRFGTTEGLPALDFGCGFGMFLELLAATGFRPVGLDPATQHLITQFPMVESVPETPTYAVILAKHVLEHLPNPLGVLQQFRRALLPNGVLALGMPTLDGLEKHRKLKYCINEAQHVSAFTRRSLSAMLARAGLRAVAFYQDEGRSYRMRCIAVRGERPQRIWWPLRDARLSLLRYRHAMREPLWQMALPIRYWTSFENVRVQEALRGGRAVSEPAP